MKPAKGLDTSHDLGNFETGDTSKNSSMLKISLPQTSEHKVSRELDSASLPQILLAGFGTSGVCLKF
jgi:hypothetical protein